MEDFGGLDDFAEYELDNLMASLDPRKHAPDEFCCPRCFYVRWDCKRRLGVREFCPDDGVMMLPFSPMCACGKTIWSFADWRVVRFRLRFPFFYEEFELSPLSGTFCTRCGRPLRKQYDDYLRRWKQDNRADRGIPDAFLKGVR